MMMLADVLCTAVFFGSSTLINRFKAKQQGIFFSGAQRQA